MNEPVEIVGQLARHLDEGIVASVGLFESVMECEGWPRHVSCTIDQARALRDTFAPTNFVPLDNDTFQLPFTTLHVLR